MFIQRDFNRTENDDFKLNVEPKLGKLSNGADLDDAIFGSGIEYKEAIEIKDSKGNLVGWKIQYWFD